VADNSEIEQAIYECIWKVKPSLKSLPMTPATRLSSLGLASIDILCVVFEIEERFGVSIVDRQLDTFKTIGEGRDVVKRLQAEDATSAPAPAME
jgi:acyl carrier protein